MKQKFQTNPKPVETIRNVDEASKLMNMGQDPNQLLFQLYNHNTIQ